LRRRKLERYQNLSGDSTVWGYEIGVDSITVQFKDKSVYIYNNASAGAEHIKNLKQLAVAGRGLYGYIMLNVKKKYMEKLR
jgi:hypothetical protein